MTETGDILSLEEAIDNKDSLYFHIIISDWERTLEQGEIYAHNPLNQREKAIALKAITEGAPKVLRTVIPDMVFKKEERIALSKLGLIQLPEDGIRAFYENFVLNNKNDLYLSKIENFVNTYIIPLVPEKARKRTGGLLELTIEDSRANKFVVSGHFIDQKLKTTSHKKGRQLDIFETLLPGTKEKIKEIDRELIVEGIKLTEKEEQILNGILRLFHEKSDTKKDSKNQPSNRLTYYKGNQPSSLELTYGGKNTSAPFIKFKPSELYDAVLSNKNASGKEVKDIKDGLYSLQDKKFLIAYQRKYKQGNKEKFDRIEEYRPLIKIVTYFQGLTEEELRKVEAGDEETRNKRGEIILALNPIFNDQIDSKFIEYPNDINKLTRIARGGGRVHTAITQLRDYLIRAISTLKKKGIERHTIDKENLPYILGLDNYIKDRRKKLIEQRIEESIETCKNLNIITEVNIITGAKGQAQYEFILNLNY